jgi:hypothetical protein
MWFRPAGVARDEGDSMRATEGNRRALAWQKLGGLIAAGLVALSIMGSGTASAANTRDIIFGSPGVCGSTATTPGCLAFAPTTAGGATAVDVVVDNAGGQTVNHVVIRGGVIAEQTVNPGFPPPSPTSLPSGASFLAGYPSGGSLPDCAVSSVNITNDSIACDIGQMSKHTSVQFRIVLNAPTTTGDLWLDVNLNEGTSNTGTNADTFYAAGTINVSPATCDQVGTYFLRNQAIALSNTVAGTCGQQVTSIGAASFGNQGAFASVGLSDGFACPAAITSCFGRAATVTVATDIIGLAPVTVPGGLQWTMQILASSFSGKPKGVLHFHNDYNPTDKRTYDEIDFKNQQACSTHLTSNCWVSNLTGYVTIGGLKYFQAVFVTPTNGAGRMF